MGWASNVGTSPAPPAGYVPGSAPLDLQGQSIYDSTGPLMLPADETLAWTGRTKLLSNADGQLLMVPSSAGTTLLQVGGTSSSFPALKRASAALQARLADDSADAGLLASSLGVSALGSAASPAVALGTSGVGLYQYAAGKLAIAANAQNVVTIDPTDTNGVVITLAGTFSDGASPQLKFGTAGSSLVGYSQGLIVRDAAGTSAGDLIGRAIYLTGGYGGGADALSAVSGNVMAGAGFSFRFNGRSRITDGGGDGSLSLTNNAGTGFTFLRFGPNAGTGPALKVNGTTLQVRLANDAGDAPLSASNASFSGTLGVTGASTLAALSATTGSFSSTLGVTGASTLAALSATNATLSGTLGVTGTSTLAALSATTGSFSSTLGVSGAVTLSSTLQIPNGTAAAPSLFPAGATTSGLYYDTTNSALSFSLAGNQRHLFGALNVLSGGSTYGALQFASGGAYLSYQPGVSGRIAAIAAANNAYAAMINGGCIVASNLGSALVNTASTQGVAINNGCTLFAANTQVVSAVLNSIVGWQLTGASAQLSSLQYLVSPKTANYTVVQADSSSLITNTGATGAVQVTLPTTPILGTTITVHKTANQTLTVVPGGSDLIHGLSGSSFTQLTVTSQYGSAVLQYVSTNNWHVVASQGASANTLN